MVEEKQSNEWKEYLKVYNSCCEHPEMQGMPHCKGNRLKAASLLRDTGLPADIYCNQIKINNDMKIQIVGRENNIQAMTKNILELEASLRKSEFRVRELSETETKLKQQYQLANRQLEEKSEEFNTKVYQLQQESQNLLHRREQDQKQLQASLDRCKTENERYRDKVKSTNKRMDKREDEHEALTLKLDNALYNSTVKSSQLEQENEQFKSRIYSLNSDIEGLRQSISELENVRDKSITEHTNCKEELQKAISSLQQCQYHHKECAGILITYKNRSELLQKDINDNIRKLDVNQQINEKLETHNKELQHEIKMLKMHNDESIKIQCDNSDEMQKLKDNIKSLKNEVESSHMSASDIKKKLESLEKKCRESIQQKEDQIESQKENHKITLENVKQLENKIQILESAKRSLENDLTNCNSKLATASVVSMTPSLDDFEVPMAPPLNDFEVPMAPSLDDFEVPQAPSLDKASSSASSAAKVPTPPKIDFSEALKNQIKQGANLKRVDMSLKTNNKTDLISQIASTGRKGLKKTITISDKEKKQQWDEENPLMKAITQRGECQTLQTEKTCKDKKYCEWNSDKKKCGKTNLSEVLQNKMLARRAAVEEEDWETFY